MRWDRLFDDLEGQLAAGERRELDDEVAERTRRERALVPLADRWAGAVGATVTVALLGGARVEGEVADVGDGWVLVKAVSGREVLLPATAVATVAGLARPATGAASSGPVRSARRFGLGSALRALARDRATVAVALLGGGPPLVGTIDVVGADHLDLAEHPEGAPRRRGNVTATTTVASAAVISVESRR